MFKLLVFESENKYTLHVTLQQYMSPWRQTYLGFLIASFPPPPCMQQWNDYRHFEYEKDSTIMVSWSPGRVMDVIYLSGKSTTAGITLLICLFNFRRFQSVDHGGAD